MTTTCGVLDVVIIFVYSLYMACTISRVRAFSARGRSTQRIEVEPLSRVVETSDGEIIIKSLCLSHLIVCCAV